MDILPDIQLGPVGERKDPNTLPRSDTGVVEIPEFRPLILGVPAVAGAAKGKNTFLGPGFFLVTPRASEGSVEFVFVQGLLEPFGLHHIGIQRRTMGERIDSLPDTLFIDVHQQIKPVLGRHPVAEGNHFTKLPCCVYMHQRKRESGRVKGLEGQTQHYRGILADGIQHHRVCRFGCHLADDVYALSFKLAQVGHG